MLRAVLSLALSAVVVFATASVVVRLVSNERVPSGTRITGLAWSDRVFTSKQEFAAFLASKGVVYEDWADRHPGAAPWQRSGAPAGAAAVAAGEEATTGRGIAAGPAVAPSERAAGKATNVARPSPPASAASPSDGLASRLAPAALVLALVMLLLLTARRVGLRPAVVALPAAGPAFDHPRGRPPTAPMRPPVSIAKAAVAVATATQAPRAEIVDTPAPDALAAPRRPVGARLRAIASAAGAAARIGVVSLARSPAALAAVFARAVAVATSAGARVRKRETAPRQDTPAPARALVSAAGAVVRTGLASGARWFAAVVAALTGAVAGATRPGALVRKRAAAPRQATLARARLIRIAVSIARLAARAAARMARATVAGVESVRWFLRGRGFNALDAATYSLAVVAAAGIGVLIAFVAGR